MTRRNELYIAWVDSFISESKAQHNHKENRAWAATAFYWTAIVLFSINVPETLNIIALIVLTPLIVIVSLGVRRFVKTQLELCRVTHWEIVAANLIKKKLIEHSNQPKDIPANGYESNQMPDSINIPFPHLFGIIKETYEKEHKRNMPLGRKELEQASDIIIMMGLLVVLLFLWSPAIKGLIPCLRRLFCFLL